MEQRIVQHNHDVVFEFLLQQVYQRQDWRPCALDDCSLFSGVYHIF
jgi:hypothetical protein